MQEAGNLREAINASAESVKRKPRKKEASGGRYLLVYGAFLTLVFVLGFAASWLSGRETLRQRDAAQANLRLSQLQNRLATAAINARRGEYESARLAASDFFTDLRAEFERSPSAFSPHQRASVKPILDGRDELITLLARNDRAAAERLTDLYLDYARVINPSPSKAQ